MSKQELVDGIIDYAKVHDLTKTQKETIREIMIFGKWIGKAAEDTTGGFSINLRKLDEYTLETIYSILYQNNILKPK